MRRLVLTGSLFALLLTAAPVTSAAGPRWTVAFLRADGVYVARPGAAPRRILVGADRGSLAWSPDGRYLAFARFHARGIYVASVDGREQWRVARDYAAPVWSPDGRKIAFRSDRGVFVVDRDGRHAKRLLARPRGTVAWVGSSRIVCACVDALLLADVGSPSVTTLATRTADGLIHGVAVSSDAEIAFGRHCDAAPFGGDTYCEITVMRADGTGAHSVVPHADGEYAGPGDFDPVWVPGTHRLLLSRLGRVSDLQLVDADGMHTATLRTDIGRVVAADAGGAFAYEQPRRVLVCAADGSVRASVAIPYGNFDSTAVRFY